ncbi:unnamed protein product [Camellia sinensis]
MSNVGRKPDGGVPGRGGPGRADGLIPASFRSLSRMVLSGASTVASTVQSASSASAIVERDSHASHYQVGVDMTHFIFHFYKIKVLWAGFDKLEWEGSTTRQVLLLGYRSGFQVWDVEEADNVHDLVSRHDGPVSFMQVLTKPKASKRSGDKFGDSRPLPATCADESFSGGGNGNNPNCHYPVHGGFTATVVWFYSLISQSYVNVLFRLAIYSVRCSTRVVAISQAAQIHCLDAATLEREYTILTNPIVTGYSGFGGIGCGPLTMGPRWLAYSVVAISNSGRVSPQHLTPSVSFPGSASNGSLVVHYSKESSKQLAAGIVTLGDMGYKKLSRYYSELLPESNNSPQSGNPGWKVNGTVNGHLPDVENVGMVIVIQDNSFSDDSHWIMISSSRGTSVMTKPVVCWPPNSGSQMLSQQNICASGPPVTLSVVGRIRSGNSSWRSTVSGAAATATGRMSSLSGTIASAFHNCQGTSSLKAKYHLLVFSPSGSVIQYALRASSGLESATVVSGLGSYNSAPETDARLLVEAIQKWNICQKQNQREREDNIDMYGESGNSDNSKIYPEGITKENGGYPEVKGSNVIAKICPEKRNHIFISEAELQTQSQTPLRAKPQIYFQSMTIDGEGAPGWEIEIERIPTCMIEARSKNLVPVFESLPTPKFQQARTPASNSSSNGRRLHQTSGLAEDGRLSCRSSSFCSVDAMTDGVAVTGLDSHFGETEWEGLMPTVITNGFVNNSDSPKSNMPLEIVHNRELNDGGPSFFCK